jgi:hypothetical protein
MKFLREESFGSNISKTDVLKKNCVEHKSISRFETDYLPNISTPVAIVNW